MNYDIDDGTVNHAASDEWNGGSQDAGRKIAEMSPNAAGLLVAVMDSNARAAAKLDEQIIRWQKEETEQWMNRALAAEERLARIQDRLMDLLA